MTVAKELTLIKSDQAAGDKYPDRTKLRCSRCSSATSRTSLRHGASTSVRGMIQTPNSSTSTIFGQGSDAAACCCIYRSF